jgi:hypothetical protein
MAIDYAAIRAGADQDIAEAGFAAVLRKPGVTTGDAWDPTPGTPVPYPVVLVETAFDERLIDGSRVKAEDRRFLMSVGALVVEPTNADTLVLPDGTELDIVRVQPLRPGGVTLLWDLQARA